MATDEELLQFHQGDPDLSVIRDGFGLSLKAQRRLFIEKHLEAEAWANVEPTEGVGEDEYAKALAKTLHEREMARARHDVLQAYLQTLPPPQASKLSRQQRRAKGTG